ncbi:LysR family transcriptional regulator [Paenibacillus psychroresistens]|uniref:LysR family transcriptional regulator n=1 Tax=Paenibacillus psychroresistens TaxID=1778678 RepID=A0A6B8RTA8_9BACL|nr:LysR family transcriptional regulator [Paenibacillus psychroresistens]QGQ98546.1 LysR family transcriptional regulator [Paenibacillus psychroresistens]
MNLHALKIFAKVALHGSVTQAADELRISQPAVTAQIRNLEKELNTKLISPKGRGIILTSSGEILAKDAIRLFALESEIEARMKAYNLGHLGSLQIVSTYLPANYLLPLWLSQFKQLHALIDCTLTTKNSTDAMESLLHYEAELAVIGGGAVNHPLIHSELLFEDPLWFVVPTKHPYADQAVALDQMMNEPFILREEGSSSRDKLFALCKIQNAPPPRIGLQFNGLSESIRAVIGGYGAIFVSALEVREYIERGELARVYVQDVNLVNPISLCRRAKEELSPAAAKFRQAVLQLHQADLHQ